MLAFEKLEHCTVASNRYFSPSASVLERPIAISRRTQFAKTSWFVLCDCNIGFLQSASLLAVTLMFSSLHHGQFLWIGGLFAPLYCQTALPVWISLTRTSFAMYTGGVVPLHPIAISRPIAVVLCFFLLPFSPSLMPSCI